MKHYPAKRQYEQTDLCSCFFRGMENRTYTSTWNKNTFHSVLSRFFMYKKYGLGFYEFLDNERRKVFDISKIGRTRRGRFSFSQLGFKIAFSIAVQLRFVFILAKCFGNEFLIYLKLYKNRRFKKNREEKNSGKQYGNDSTQCTSNVLVILETTIPLIAGQSAVVVNLLYVPAHPRGRLTGSGFCSADR
jgi:hypothetical protein